MARRRPALPLPTIAHKHSHYATRSGRCSRAAAIAAKALTDKPVFIEDEDGHRIRLVYAKRVRREGDLYYPIVE